ncbi:GNAT family N-acetyltransferase [Fodinicola acaciae]|uniref:GNAT family N-acetyltransferase n=1 Tax=Fodinicola acaciae TaxID=2681555 RepID=UPI0013D0113A|nr:GNAT family N-acetyltransferase [Fodinicola acaciae]
MTAPIISVTDTVDERTAEVVTTGLDEFNKAAAGYNDRQPLCVTVTDAASGEVVGGAIGRSSLGLLFLDYIYLPARLRGGGLGSRLLAAFEAEGRRRGCRAAVLYTISFQAPGFYQKRGWTVFGEVPSDPPGTSRIFLRKLL